MNKYTTLESTIRALGKTTASQPLEKDLNDQVHAGSYSSKNFEVSKPAQKLFANLPKHIDSDDAEESLKLHDKLFGIHKKVKATGRATPTDINAARILHDQILKIARNMGNEDAHGHVKDSLKYIEDNVDTESNIKTDIKPEDAAKRFASTPKDYQSDVKSDADIDNLSKFHIARDKRAQRKLKIIDDEFKPGETAMSKMLEAMKQVQANEQELEEKKLVGKQKKLDKNHNGELDADDFKKLRAEEKEESAAHEKAEKKHNNTPAGVECPVCGMKACPTVKEEAEQIDEFRTQDSLEGGLKRTDLGLSDKLNKKGKLSKHTQTWMKHLASGSRTLYSRPLGKPKGKLPEEVEQVDEAQFVVITKGSERKRIRNNPIEIGRARKEGWAITEELVSEGSELQMLGKAQAKAVVKREVQQKKAMFAKKDSVDKAKFSKSMQKIHAGDEVEMEGEEINESIAVAKAAAKEAHSKGMSASEAETHIRGKVVRATASPMHRNPVTGEKSAAKHGERVKKATAAGVAHFSKLSSMKEDFMERAIAVLGEEFKDATYEQLAEEIAKRGRGRPRKHPPKDPNAPKRGRGRPKKGSAPASTSSSSSEKKPEEAGDREHILMALRKSVSLRGQHGVKFANGETHKISAEHAAHAMRIHDSLSKPSEKMVFQRKLGASHDSFKKALQDKSPGTEEKKKTGITLAKRAD